MAKFAQDCMNKLDRVVERLSTSLGEGTDELALRTGMHSGEVTAGVLRGEKGRFQLFGGKSKTLIVKMPVSHQADSSLTIWLPMYRYGEYGFENGEYWDSKTDPSVSNNSRRFDSTRKTGLVGPKEGGSCCKGKRRDANVLFGIEGKKCSYDSQRECISEKLDGP